MTLVIQLHASQPPDWWRLENDAVADRGTACWPVRRPGEAALAAAPATCVTLHRVMLASHSMAQARAAANMLAIPLVADPADIHVAIGVAETAAGARWLAIADAGAMAHWIAALGENGFDDSPLLPAPMLLGASATVRCWQHHGTIVVRGPAMAFAAELDLAARLAPDAEQLDTPTFEAGLALAIGQTHALDLRQGIFARARPGTTIAWRRCGWLAAAIIGLVVAGNAAQIWRISLAVTSINAQAQALARAATGPGNRDLDPIAALATRARQAADPEHGAAAAMEAVAEVLRLVPGVVLVAVDRDLAGHMRVLVSADRVMALDLLEPLLARQGYTASSLPSVDAHPLRLFRR